MLLPVIGLEIHLQVKTNSKMFCRCKSSYFNDEPNTNTCPVCLGLPGALPVPNLEAFNKCLQLAIALNCEISNETKFDRKNYFYPDIPKGFQISQYDQPIGNSGYIEIEVEGDSRRIRLERVHLEEDTGKSLHSDNGKTLVDFNKSGVALIEIVTKPDFESTEEVILFAKRLRQIVRYLDVSDAEMQKGQMRFELNISMKPDTQKELPNYKVEVKNIGSISVLEKVLKFEAERQSKILEAGETPVQETRGLKDMTGETLSQRTKEGASDYRYFPEPDIPPVHITTEKIEDLRNKLPLMPAERKAKYVEIGLEFEQADILIENTDRGNWFDNYLSHIDDFNQEDKKFFAKEGAKWLLGDISYQLEKRNTSADNYISYTWRLLSMIEAMRSKITTGTTIKKLISDDFERDDQLANLLDYEGVESAYKAFNDELNKKGLIQISDASEIDGFITEVINNNAKIIEDMKKNPNAIKFLVGQVMKISKGKVNPNVAEEKLRNKLITD
jgi:aspartyl-tRNA(Asn)/glutamyl-tRNA(Gln) amidotransferase subunit B